MSFKASYCIVFIIICCSCQQAQRNYQPPVFPREYEAKTTIINDSIMLSFFTSPLLIDSVLIIADVNQDTILSLYHKKTGKLLKKAGVKGRGPGEMTLPTKFSIDSKQKKIYVFDYAKKNIVKYDIDKILNSAFPYFEELPLSPPLDNENEITFLKDSLYICSNQNHRLLIATSSQQIAVCEDYVDLPGMTPRLWNSFLQTWASNAISPQGDRYASITSLGGIMEIYNLKNDIHLSQRLFFFEPMYEVVNNQIIPVPETYYCASGIATTDQYIYVTAFAKQTPTERPKLIWQFDWEGTPIASFKCPYQIAYFTVDQDDKNIYAIVFNENYEEAIAHIDITHHLQ